MTERDDNMDAVTSVEELEAWTCPECGAGGARYCRDLIGTYDVGVTEAGSFALTFGTTLGPPNTEERPVGYIHTLTCENGHEQSWFGVTV